MPIRPSFTAQNPSGPSPRSMRRVTCPHCSGRFDISRKAMSVRCPRCTRPLAFEDLTVRHPMEGDIRTMGHVDLQHAGSMNGRIICGQLTNAGSLQGEAVVYGPVTCAHHSDARVALTATSLAIEAGATFTGRVHIEPCPEAKPEIRDIAIRAHRKRGG